MAVGAAHQVVELARACPRLEKVEFVSTVGVGGHLAVVPETWLSEPRAFHNTYEQAKAEAEESIRGEVERGSPGGGDVADFSGVSGIGSAV